MAESVRRVEGGAIPELPVRETGRENPVASAVSKPLKEVAELPERMARTPEIGRRVSTQSKTGALGRMKHASMRALGKLQPKEEELQRAGSSLTRRVEEGGVAYEGETARVRDLNGTTMEFKKAGELGRGGESSAFDARVQGDGKVHQRAFVQVGRYLSILEQQGRLHELQSLHQELNKRAPIGVRVYGFSTVVNTNNAESSVGILMDRGRPIFRGEGLLQEERVAFCKQLLSGVQAMHKNGITHGDIKVSIERQGDREIDLSNLMMRINDKGEREPCLIDWGESIDHTALRSLEQEKAASLASEKVPSPAFTPYELTSQLRQTCRGLDRLSPAEYKKGLDKYFELRKAQDEFNTAVAIVQILSGHEEDFSHEVIRVQGASRGEYEPDVAELLKNIPEKTPKDLRNFLEKTLKKETKLI